MCREGEGGCRAWAAGGALTAGVDPHHQRVAGAEVVGGVLKGGQGRLLDLQGRSAGRAGERQLRAGTHARTHGQVDSSSQKRPPGLLEARRVDERSAAVPSKLSLRACAPDACARPRSGALCSPPSPPSPPQPGAENAVTPHIRMRPDLGQTRQPWGVCGGADARTLKVARSWRSLLAARAPSTAPTPAQSPHGAHLELPVQRVDVGRRRAGADRLDDDGILHAEHQQREPGAAQLPERRHGGRAGDRTTLPSGQRVLVWPQRVLAWLEVIRGRLGGGCGEERLPGGRRTPGSAPAPFDAGHNQAPGMRQSQAPSRCSC